MADLSIPIVLDSESPSYDIAVTLDEIAYILRIEYNARDDSWFVSLYDESGELLIGSQPLIEGWPLFSRHKPTFADMPQGDMYLVGDSLIYREAS